MPFAPPARHLLRARDLADVPYFEPLDVEDMARAADQAPIPACIVRMHGRPEHRTFREDSGPARR
jgi:hypothetical protein